VDITLVIATMKAVSIPRCAIGRTFGWPKE
jgi:hypothetical protein